MLWLCSKILFHINETIFALEFRTPLSPLLQLLWQGVRCAVEPVALDAGQVSFSCV